MKYRFEVHYLDKVLKQISEEMKKLDSNFSLYANKQIVTLISQINLPIQEIKNTIIEGYQANDCDVVHIEGGLVE